MSCTIMIVDMSVTHNVTLNPGIIQNTKAQFLRPFEHLF